MRHATAPLILADMAPITDSLAQHAQACMPRECCGLVVRLAGGGLQYLPCDNVAAGNEGQDRFEIAPAQYAAAEDAHDIVAICHSHPNASANPSEADLVMCERTGLPWLIMGYPSQVLRLVQPQQYVAPLLGRSFHHGILDCYTLLEDYYQRTLGVTLPRFARQDNWWVPDANHQVQDLYNSQYAQAGFVEVNGPPAVHDVLLMQVRSDVLNHAAIYLGDNKLLHHLHSRLSCEDVWGGYWQRHTGKVLRHSSQTNPTGAPL